MLSMDSNPVNPIIVAGSFLLLFLMISFSFSLATNEWPIMSAIYLPLFRIVVLQVSSSDMLASIAAKFDTTTSELMKLNKLMSQMIFPGQVP